MTVNDQHKMMLEICRSDAEILMRAAEDALLAISQHDPGKRNKDAHAISLLNCNLLRAISEATFCARRVTDTIQAAARSREDES